MDIVGGSPAPTFNATFTLSGESVPVSEPSTLLLLGSGLTGLCGLRWRRRRQYSFSAPSIRPPEPRAVACAPTRRPLRSWGSASPTSRRSGVSWRSLALPGHADPRHGRCRTRSRARCGDPRGVCRTTELAEGFFFGLLAFFGWFGVASFATLADVMAARVYRVSVLGAAASGRDVSHQAAAAAQQMPRRKPPNTSEGQWAWRTMRAQPTASMKHTASATTADDTPRASNLA